MNYRARKTRIELPFLYPAGRQTILVLFSGFLLFFFGRRLWLRERQRRWQTFNASHNLFNHVAGRFEFRQFFKEPINIIFRSQFPQSRGKDEFR